MVVITLQRNKCIGCNYCEELCPDWFKMSKKDGKSVLLKGINRKGFYTTKVHPHYLDAAEKAGEACPVNIISVKLV